MHATHQFFLTKRSLYLLVLDSRKGEQESNLHYWLKIVQSYGGDSPVLIVMNKCDEYRMEINERSILRDYAPNVRGFVYTSAMTGEGVDELRAAIQSEISSMPHVFNRLPITYFRVKAEIEETARSQDFLNVSTYNEICAKHDLNEPGERQQLLRFLHDLGTVLNFDDPADPYGLRETKILNPEWVTRAVYRIINNPLLIQQREGELELSQLGRILADPKRYPKEQHPYILEIMRKFELCFEFPNSNGQRFLIPELLPVREPELNWNETDVLAFEYHYEILPSGIMCRLIVRNSQYIGKPPINWRSGVVFHIANNQCLVRANVGKHRISIEIKGEQSTRKNALAIIRRELDQIHRTIPKLQVSGKVPLPDQPNVLVDYGHLEKLQELGIDRFVPEGATRQYEVSQLLTGVQTADSAPSTLYVRKMVLENIRCFEQLELDFNAPGKFRPLTMLLGDNGVGKTTVLRCLALALCDETGASSLMSQLSGEMLHQGSDEGKIRVWCGGSDSELATWEITTVLTRRRGNVIELKKIVPDELPLQRLFVCGYGALRRGFGDKSYQRYELADSVRSLFDYSASLQNPELVFRRIEAAGHSVQKLCQKVAQLLELEPDAVRIDASGISISGPWGEFTPVGAIGDGYQATLAWLADFLGWALFYDERFFSRPISGLMLVDEIEKHLHPRWQRQIIRRLNEQFPQVQFVVTSHSPICAGGVSDLEPGDGALYLFSSEEPVQSIEPPAGWRYDQIITSSAFGLTSSRDVTTEALQERLRKAHDEHGKNAAESTDFKLALEELESRSVTAAQDEVDRQNRSQLLVELQTVKKLLEDQKR
jgi:GTPase SAR1 family protein